MTERIAVITGAGQGIGRAVALRLATGGVVPVLVGRTAAKLEATAREVAAQGVTARVYAADVSDAVQVERLAAWLDETVASVDMLVNCAGESYIAGVGETPEEDWDHILAVNLKAPYLMARALLPLLRRSANASIVHLVSKVALRGYANVTAYTAAKTGLLGFSRSLAAELRADEIRVVPICPGPVDTPMRWAATPDFDRKVVIDTQVVADAVWQVVTLPRGTTMGELLVESMHYD